MIRFKLIITLFLLSINYLLIGQEQASRPKWIELHGYIKDIQNLNFTNDIDSLSSLNLLHNRLSFKFNISKTLSARLEIRNRVFYGDQVTKTPDFGSIINQYNGLLNLSKLWVDEKTLVIQSVVDRMLLEYATNDWDITIGRQRINWGVNNVWNPNDIFNAYNFLDFDYEERPGNDAVRVRRYFKNYSTLEFAYKPGKEKREHIAAVLYKFNRHQYDYQVLGGISQSDLVVGGGWAGSIKQAGFKGEISYFHPYEHLKDTFGIVSLSLMADQTFKNDWYVSVATLFNSNPSHAFETSGSVFNPHVSAKELFPYRYTFYAGVIKSFTPVTSVNFSIIYSPEKNTLILFPAFAYNAAKNLDLDFTMQSFFSNTDGKYIMNGTALYLRGRWSF